MPRIDSRIAPATSQKRVQLLATSRSPQCNLTSHPPLPAPPHTWSLQNERLRAAAYADTLSALQMEHAAAGEVVDAGGADERASSIAAAVERVRRRGGGVASALAAPASWR